jgi:hypothetical protein
MFVKVTAKLASPIALSPEGAPPHLDAICELVMARKSRSIAESKNGHRHAIDVAKMRGQPVEAPGQLPIPIVRERVDGLPIPRCSQGIIDASPQVAEHYHCAFPLERAGMLAEKQRTVLQQTGGPYKSMRLPLRISNTPSVVWFAQLRRRAGKSPMNELRGILRKVSTIGKKSNYGYGLVSEWLVEPTDIDAVWICEGVLMRPLPVSVVPEGTLGAMRSYGAVCGPYWQSSFFVERFVPI